MEELETIDDETDEHGIQFVKSNDVKLAHEIGIFAFPALVYYETGVPIMYDGMLKNVFFLCNYFQKLFLSHFLPFYEFFMFINIFLLLGNLKNENRVLQWLIEQKSKN